jgi:hypothetical protein
MGTVRSLEVLVKKCNTKRSSELLYIPSSLPWFGGSIRNHLCPFLNLPQRCVKTEFNRVRLCSDRAIPLPRGFLDHASSMRPIEA